MAATLEYEIVLKKLEEVVQNKLSEEPPDNVETRRQEIQKALDAFIELISTSGEGSAIEIQNFLPLAGMCQNSKFNYSDGEITYQALQEWSGDTSKCPRFFNCQEQEVEIDFASKSQTSFVRIFYETSLKVLNEWLQQVPQRDDFDALVGGILSLIKVSDNSSMRSLTFDDLPALVRTKK